MKINLNKIDGAYDGKECFVHPRACALDKNNIIMTMQTLNVYGSDYFSPLYVLKSSDGGKTWTKPIQDEAFTVDVYENGVSILGCDATHIFHKKTGVPLLTGRTVAYEKNSLIPMRDYQYETFYATYDKEAQKYNQMKILKMPVEMKLGACGAGCAQFIEADNGDVLLPVYISRGEYYTSAVVRCSFDGYELVYKDISNELVFNIGRGIGEPSLCFYNGKYYLTIRNDRYGLYSVSVDCKTFSEPEVWRWDTGDIVPTYNTQSHWLECGGNLYLVYTRKAGNNDHVFRHRAPLFMAQVDTATMRILHNTEQIVVPERGARLGNFGVNQIDENTALITASEWMQDLNCDPIKPNNFYGSDNSVYITKVEA